MEPTLVVSNLEEHLKKWFGYNTFRSYQKEIIEGILQRRDVMAILPTGAGKSLCYQLPSLLFKGTAVVISPLISLMQDQVSALAKSGIPAAYINSSLSLPELQDILENLTSYKLVYVAPERFCDPYFLERLKAIPLSFFVIDEAHCISQWGHSFRPDYRALSLIKKNFPDKPLMALTATATPEVEKDITTQLLMKDALVAKGSFDRPNLMIRINGKSNPYSQIKEFIKNRRDQSGIIYASTRKTVDLVHEQLKNEGLLLGKYHAGMSDQERRESLHDFIHDKINLMVATVAFGMGINKPDVRFIIHHDMPRTIEQYYQEIGRAGRDGLPAECLMLYSSQDLMIYKSFSKQLTDLDLRAQMESKTGLMYSLCHSLKCRRAGLLNYFGENYPAQECSGCDNCVDEEEKIDGTVIAQKILSCVYRLQERFGVRHVIDVLRGSKNNNVMSRGHDRLSTYNIMSECSEAEVRYYIDSLLMLGLLKTSDGEYPVIQLTDTSRNAMNGTTKTEFRKKIFKEKIKEAVQLPYNAELFDLLRQLRLEIARQDSVPPFVVFSDKSLFEMATYFPHTDDDLLSINGVGRHKLEHYGERFLQSIKEFCQTHSITPLLKTENSMPLRPNPPAQRLNPSAQDSFQLFMQKKSIDEIAQIRGCTARTVVAHICRCIESSGPEVAISIDSQVSKERQEAINAIVDTIGTEKLAPIKQLLPEEISYDEIHFVVAMRRRAL